jgi:Zn-dependent protease
MPTSSPDYVISALLVILFGLSFHEYAHAKVADMSGDPTPRMYGRVTLNPLKHLDPLGTILIIYTVLAGFGIGWGKPVPVNPSRMHNPRWDHFWSVAAGPISNLIQAALYAIVFRIAVITGVLQGAPFLPVFLELGVLINLSLCFFNLIPLGPLDGQWMLGAFLPEKQRFLWYRWNAMYGGILLLGIVFIGQFQPQYSLIGHVLRPVVFGMAQLLMGLNPVA